MTAPIINIGDFVTEVYFYLCSECIRHQQMGGCPLVRAKKNREKN
jgi:hypothetical protein